MANSVTSFQVQGQNYGVNANLTFDAKPTIGSVNPVTSNGIAEAIRNVELGDTISYGRREGSPAGYCSVAYGTNNVASADSSIVFGINNVSLTTGSFVSGESNTSIGHRGNIVAGHGNRLSAFDCIELGGGNESGIYINPDVDLTNHEDVYIGYYNPSTKKLYYDRDLQEEYTVVYHNHSDRYPNGYGTTYILDVTDDSSVGRIPGDIYKYSRTQNGIVTVSRVLNKYVRLCNYTHTTIYYYKGCCYYDETTDKNYKDSSQTQMISTNTWPFEARANYLWFDVNSGYFINHPDTFNNSFVRIGNAPQWIKVDAYPIAIDNMSLLPSSHSGGWKGRYAFVNTNASISATYLLPYASSEMEPGTEISAELVDGELVCDYSSGTTYRYVFNRDHVLCYVKRIVYETNPDYSSYLSDVVTLDSGNIISGLTSGITGGRSAIVCGNNNHAMVSSGCSAIFGSGNYTYVGLNPVAVTAYFISGVGNSFTVLNGTSNNEYIYGSTILGRNNQVNALYHPGTRSMSGGQYYVIGESNTVEGDGQAYGVYINGSGHQTCDTYEVSMYGKSNRINNASYSSVLGEYNSIRFDTNPYGITEGEDGILTGNGVSYNASTGTYTFQTGVIYKKYGFPDSDDLTFSQRSRSFLGLYISTDGTSLTSISNTFAYETNVVGCGNYFYIKTASVCSGTVNNSNNYIVGSGNTLLAGNCQKVGIVGSDIYVDFENNDQELGVMFTGCGTSMTGTHGAKFVVGIGTINDKANGLIAYTSGAVAAPSSPDTVNAVVSAMANTGISANKAIVTYGMLQDYAPKNGGAVGKPSVTIITLHAADWDGFTQTVSFPGISSSSVVINMPSGSPLAYYTNNVYLDSQGTDEVTFKCVTTPTIDISVKVVYWA